jgi:ribosomal protein S18 acetylase RimI-like enzyme
MSLDDLTPLSAELVEKASITSALAFAEDPTTAYLIPEPKKRVNLHYAFEYYFRLSLLDNEETYVTSAACEGVAGWVRSGTHGSFINILRAGWPSLPLRCGWRSLIREIIMDNRYGNLRERLSPKPHLYLSTLAVAPEYQGLGYASRLMKPMLERLDNEGMPAYVETQNLKNKSMYEHWGFDLLKEDRMPGTDLTLYLMLRRPKSR